MRIAIAGAGGNGSQMIGALARLDRALRSLGLTPLHVTLFDPYTVSPANVGRQLFSPHHVGVSKAIALIHAANTQFGLSWQARPERFSRAGLGEIDILITCVDTGAARREIADAVHDAQAFGSVAPVYWLDIGNEDQTGQVWLGQFPKQFVQKKDDSERLRLITEVYPDWFDGTIGESNAPSCSLAEALQTQDLFINDEVTLAAKKLLWRLLRFGEIRCQGYWVNARDDSTLPIPIELLAQSREAA